MFKRCSSKGPTYNTCSFPYVIGSCNPSLVSLLFLFLFFFLASGGLAFEPVLQVVAQYLADALILLLIFILYIYISSQNSIHQSEVYQKELLRITSVASPLHMPPSLLVSFSILSRASFIFSLRIIWMPVIGFFFSAKTFKIYFIWFSIDFLLCSWRTPHHRFSRTNTKQGINRSFDQERGRAKWRRL